MQHSTASTDATDENTDQQNCSNTLSNANVDTKLTASQKLKIVEEQNDGNKNNDECEADECDEVFKEKILNTKLSEENKENNLSQSRRIMRGLSQVTLPPAKFE